MDRFAARRVLGAALLLGVLAELLFDGPRPGINVPVAVGAILTSSWLLRRRGTAPDPLDAWLPVAAVASAAFVAITGDRFLALVDTTVALGFTGASVVAFAGVPVTRRGADVIAALGGHALGAVLTAAGPAIRMARPLSGLPRRLPATVAPIARGLLLGVPVALVFAVLFASADPIFRRSMDDLLGFSVDLGELPGRVVFSLACAWLAAGLLSVAATGVPRLAGASLGAAAGWQAVPRSRPLGVPEAVTILVLVDIVSGLFVGFQLAYLFGRLDTLAAAGMTYSDYARRGFFELVAAACLAGGLLVILELVIARRTWGYVAAALALVGLTVVVLVSAWQRLELYQLAYGWTELRFYVAAAIVTLAVALGLGGVLLVRDRMRWLGHGLVAIGLVSLLTLNALAPAAFVATRNIERGLDAALVPDGGYDGIDTGYLGALGDDAVPVMVQALSQLDEPLRTQVLWELRERRDELTRDPGWTSPAAWNLARERAKAALANLP